MTVCNINAAAQAAAFLRKKRSRSNGEILNLSLSFLYPVLQEDDPDEHTEEDAGEGDPLNGYGFAGRVGIDTE